MFRDLSLGKSFRKKLTLEPLEIRIVPAIAIANEIFVENTFYNILSRAPNAEELATFSAELGNGYDREDFVSDMWRSEPHRTLQITQMYSGFLNRDLNAGDDLAGKITRMNTNDLLQINEKNPLSAENKELKTIFVSAEYTRLHPANSDFVTSLYRLLDHQPNFEDVNRHVASIESFGADISGGRAAVVDAVLTGVEYEFKSMARLYQTILHRNPDNQDIANVNFASQFNYSSQREEMIRISTSLEGQAQGNIEQVYVSVTAPLGNINEGDLALFTVTLSRPASKNVSINYETVSGIAISNIDYIFESDTLVFAIGETTKTVGIETLIDFIGEDTESFGLSLSPSLETAIPGTQEAWEQPLVYQAILQASAGDSQQAQIVQFMNKIRSVETFSDPLNPGQIVAGLVPNGFPNPDARNNPATKTSGTKGLSTYPGDARNTPGAYQVDLANMNNVFGIWSGVAGSLKDSSPENTQFAFSKAALNTYFGIQVDANGFITEIGPDAASIFLQNDSLANSTNFNNLKNPLIGQNIQNFKYEQLSLFLAGRLADDSTAGPSSLESDTRIATDSVQHRVEDIQLNAAKTFVYNSYLTALKNNPANVADFGPGGFTNVEALFGSTLKITSSSTAFGVTNGQVFFGTLNPSFLNGYGYVGGYFGLRPVLKAVLDADAHGTSTVTVQGTLITITRTMEGNTKVFSFNKTPINVDPSYPSFFHYGALLSQFKEINMANAADWSVSSTPFSMGYATTGTQTPVQITGTATVPSGGNPNAYKVNYTGLEMNQTMTVSGNGTYNFTPASAVVTPSVVVTNKGYNSPQNNSQSVSSGQKIDMSAYNTNYTTASSHFYYVKNIQGTDIAFAPNDPALLNKENLFFYYLPAANNVTQAQAAIDSGDFSSFSPNFRAFRVSVANYTILGPALESNFIFVAPPIVIGTGIVNATASTGFIFIEVDKSINRMNLGSGYNQILDSNTTATTYFINSRIVAPLTIFSSIQGFDLGSVSDTLDLTSFNSVTNLDVIKLTSFNNKSQAPGSSVASFYDQYSYSGTVSFNANSENYYIEVGTTSNTAIIDFRQSLLARINK